MKNDLQNRINIIENELRQLRVKQGEIESAQRKKGKTKEGQKILDEIFSRMNFLNVELNSLINEITGKEEE